VQAIAAGVASANRQFERPQRVRSFIVVGEPWSEGAELSGGELNRGYINQRYAVDIAALYQGEVLPATPTPAAPAPAGPVPAPLIDPTPSYSSVLKPIRPLGSKDPAAGGTPPAPSFESGWADDNTAMANFESFGGDQTTGGYYGGGDAQGGNWGGEGAGGEDSSKRWWWAILVALVIVALGAVAIKTIKKHNSSSSPTTLAADSTMPSDSSAVSDTVADTSPSTDATTTVPSKTLLEDVTSTANLTTFLAAVKAAGLDTELSGPGPFTVFAPTDAAFAKLPADVLTTVLANKDLLVRILHHHMIDGSINVEDLKDGPLTAKDGTTITVALATAGGTDVTLNGNVRPVTTDVVAGNGVLHTIDTVMIPADIDPASLQPTTTTTVPPGPNYTVLFANGSTAISSTARATLKDAATQIKALPAGSVVRIVGYTAAVGTQAHREYVARYRARNVISQLKKYGARNVTYQIELVTDLPNTGDLTQTRRAEVYLPSGAVVATTVVPTTASLAN
jgi:uncharacterized surface protein with fasciclin (FAS1) repeats